MNKDEFSHIPEDFLEQVKQALKHLYDFAYLQNCDLAQQIFGRYDREESKGISFRRTLIECIEALNPGEDLLYRSSDGNAYNLLRYYYIDRMTLNEVQMELGISDRQSYRILKRGQISIAEILWEKFVNATQDIFKENDYPIQRELSRLQLNIQTFDLIALVTSAQHSVMSLAKLYDKQLHLTPHPVPIVITSNFPITQQTLIHLFSFSIKHIPSPQIKLDLEQTSEGIFLNIHYHPFYAPLSNLLEGSLIPQFVQQLGWNVAHQSFYDRSGILSIEIKAEEFTILVIDDNEELLELINRFLINKPYKVVFVTSGEQGIQTAQAIKPDIIILDIMMPKMNGWEILQHLRMNPNTEDIPVIICSVINDPELAYSLNASHVLYKPINQEKLIAALDKIIAEQSHGYSNQPIR